MSPRPIHRLTARLRAWFTRTPAPEDYTTPAALVVETARGWAVYPPGCATAVGGFATLAAAERVCRFNGWRPVS